MTSLRLAWRLLLAQSLRHLVTALIVALGLGLMLATVAIVGAARTALSTTATRFPLVIGGEIGAVPLVLGSLTELQDLSASVDHALFEELRGDERAEEVVPLLGGHTIASYPLLATTPAFLQPRDRFPLAEGRMFSGDAMEVVLGSTTALELRISLGSEVVIEHQHAGAPEEPGVLRVVGVLGPTNTHADRTMFCPLEAIYRTAADSGQSHVRRVSAILLRPAGDRGLLSLQEELDDLPGVQVALTGQTLRRVSDQLVTGGQLLRILVTGVVLITLLSLFLSVYNTALSQTRDVGVMRILGARRLHVVGVVLLVNGLVILAGALGALAVAELVGGTAERLLRQEAGIEASVALLSPATWSTLLVSAALLAAVGSQPALAAYSVQAADALVEMPGAGHSTGASLRWVLRVVAPLALVFFLFVALGQHSQEVGGAPIDAESAALFADLASWTGGEAPQEVHALDGREMSIQGYMYALGDPFTVQDFYLVAINPRLPRCPFCYRAPTKRERILVRTYGRTVDLCSGPVTISGSFHVDATAPDPYQIRMIGLEVVIPRRPERRADARPPAPSPREPNHPTHEGEP